MTKEGTQKSILTIDASGRALGRVASEAALHLMGKNDPSYERHHIRSEKVKIVNASRLRITDKKKRGVWYVRHTHFPGGIKKEKLGNVIEKKGHKEAIRRAVRGMIPQNRQRKDILKNLVIVE